MTTDALTTDERRALLILLMEDIRGSFYPVNPRTQAVIDLATDLGYDQVAAHAQEYLDDPYDGRHFRVAFSSGGYDEPPFPVIRDRAMASPALIDAVERLCEYPEYRLEAPEPVDPPAV